MRAPADIEVPKIDAKEGGKISGYGERFEVNLTTGAAGFSFPVPVPKLRGVAPELVLSYSGSVANSPYGLGFDLPLPSVARLTDKGIPRYTRDDRFLLDGSDLTPRYDQVGPDWVKSERQDGDYVITTFRQRIEGAGLLIEWWQNQANAQSHWKTVSAENTTTLYGMDDACRVFDPDDPDRIYKWLVSESCDAQGNRIIYSYKREDGAGLPAGANCAQVYISSIRYGNYRGGTGESFAIDVLFDYGEYTIPSLDPNGSWLPRSDPYVTYQAGFALKTWRLCRNIITVHNFPDEPGIGRCLSQVVALTHEETPYFSIPRTLQQIGWKTLKDGSVVSEGRPLITLSFNGFNVDESQMEPLKVDGFPPFQGPPGRGWYQFTDLYGNGIAGMLFNSASDIVYWRALGDGRYQPPASPDVFPVDRALASGGCALQDIEGNGQLDLVVRDPKRAGFYRNNNDGSWEAFVPFSSLSPEIGAPGVQFSDLDGNGRQDLLIACEPERLRVYESLGTGGYGPPTLHRVPENFPSGVRQGVVELVSFANVFGDGLQHRVRLTDGLLTVWPTLGYGQFGAPVTLRNTPRFGATLTTARIVFADISGSGYADLIYVYDDYLALHRNESGNAFSNPIKVPIPQGISDLDQINFADVFGDGKATFVLSKATAPVAHYALRLPHAKAAFRLGGIDNGFGRRTSIGYRSSTHFQLADRKAGRPWPTPLSTVLQLVEQTVATDISTGLTSATRYQYGDGYYDPVEREFRGFGYVQSLDTQAFSPQLWHFPAELSASETMSEPCLSRRWNNTGSAALIQARSVPLPRFRGEMLVPADYLDPDIFVAGGPTIREAYRALKEREAAKSVSGLDPTGVERPVAYQTSAQNYKVRMLQPRIGLHPASFQVTQRQSRSLSQEDDPADARVADAFNLAQDSFGNITLTANVAYPRSSGDGISPQQAALIVTCTQRSFINHPASEAEPYRYVGLQWEERQLDIGGLSAVGVYFNFEALEKACAQALLNLIDYGSPFTAGSIQARPYQWARDLYWNAAQSAPLPFGEIAAAGLIYEQRKAVFPPSFVASAYGGRVDDTMLEASGGDGAGYILVDGYWWNVGNRRFYAAAANYHLVNAATDPYGARTDYAYDAYDIAMVSSTDALGQTTRFSFDFQALQPFRVTDINGICTETFFSPLAAMLVFSRYGTIAGKRVGDKQLDDYQYVVPGTRADILADPEKFLQGAGSYYWEDYAAPSRYDGPVCSVLIEADRAVDVSDPQWDPLPRRFGATLTYIDASAKVLAKQSKVEATALDPNGNGDAYVVSDQVTYDEQGRVVRKYAAYASSLPALDLSPDAPCSVSFYDALGRVIRTETPPGFFAKTVYRTWETEIWDEDDTILESPYYIANIGNTDPSYANERNALLKAAQFAGTFRSTSLDPLGRSCVETQRVTYAPVGTAPPPATLYRTGTWYDSAGAIVQTADPRFYDGAATTRFNLQYLYDMSGNAIVTVSTDSGGAQPGTYRKLFDCLNNPLDRWDNAGQHIRQTYDILRRPSALFVDPLNGVPYQAESVVYGTDPSSNTCNRVVISRDQAQETRIAVYGLSDQPTAETRQFPVDVGIPVDWTDPSKVAMLPDVWSLGAVYNRRAWPTAIFNADGTVTTTGYYLNGWQRNSGLAATIEQPAQAVMISRLYSASGQPTDSSLANGTITSRSYDDATQRLTEVRTTRLTDDAVLQDDAFYYDPKGNVTRIVHRAEVPTYWKNGAASPDNDYTYDSIYRLRLATGRQDNKLSAPGAKRFVGDTEGDALVSYTESYDIDPSNNLLELRHVADGSGGQGSWTRSFAVSATSNHSVPSDMATGGKGPDDFYDENGNLAQLPNLTMLSFDYRGQMMRATLVSRDGADDDAEFYAYGRDGLRKRKTKRFQQSGSITVTEDTLYIGALIVTRRTKQSASGSATDGAASSLSVSIGEERLLVVNRTSEESATQYRYQVANNQTSVVLELNETGQLITYEEYFPYGSRALSKGRSQLDLDSKRFRFIGRELDQATGLYSVGMRYYIPSMGRFLTPDPAGSKDGLNLYAYTGCNPTTFADRSGLCRTRLTGANNLVRARQTRMDGDLDVARDMVDETVQLLENQITSRSGWLMSTLWSRGTINNPDPLVQEYFGIGGTTRTDANNLFEVLDNFRAIQTYFNRPPARSRLSWRYAQSFFINIPQFNVLQDPPRNGTIAYVQGASINWPDWSYLPQSVRSRPMSVFTGIGVVNPLVRAIRRFTPSDGINLYNRLHFGEPNQLVRASTLVHEASHLIASTDDHAYGFEDAFDNLTTTQRMYNADSYGLFAKAVYEQNHP